jgi:uncharacterized protein YkwD
MTGHGRRASVLIAVALLAAAAFAAALITSASAAGGPPTLAGAMNSRGDVRLEWRFTSSSPRTGLVLQIDRSATTASWTNWMAVNRPRPNGFRTDQQPLPGASYYRVRLFDKGVLAGTSAAVKVGSGSPTTVAPPPTATTATTVPTSGGVCATARADILRLVNQARADNHVATPLRADSRLDAAAQVHSNYMASTQSLTHDHWLDEIRAAGYPGGWLGQNAAVGYGSSDSVMQGWMGSSGHRANILSGTYRDLGVGCAKDGNGTLWWTQDFGA